MPPKDVHFLTLKSCEYITLYGKGDFADVVKLRILREINLYCQGGLNLITSFLIKKDTVREKI